MQSNATFEDILKSGEAKRPQLSTTGKILVGLTGGVAVALTVICAPFVSPALRKHCLPYVPATKNQIANVVDAMQGRSGKLLDLGSGDGRIVLAMAHRGFDAHGVELNPWLVAYSKLHALRTGYAKRAHFYRKNLWDFPFREYDNIVVFGVEQMMQDLEAKLLREGPNGCHVAACRFPLPTLQPHQTIGSGIDCVWLYRIKHKK